MGFTPYTTANRGAGAKAGLEKKMAYWKDRDYETGLNILVGQAANITVERLKQEPKADQATKEAIFREWFDFLLKMRRDPQIIQKYDSYYKEIKEIKAEKTDELPTINYDTNS